MKQILFPTDYSAPSQHALHFATCLARDCGASLLIVHVADLECYPVGELVDRTPGPSPLELERIATVVPDDAEVPFAQRVICPTSTSDNVHLADEIVKVAEKEDVYAIVIGTHARRGLMRVLAGSVAESVMRRASCAVITIRAPDRQPARR